MYEPQVVVLILVLWFIPAPTLFARNPQNPVCVFFHSQTSDLKFQTLKLLQDIIVNLIEKYALIVPVAGDVSSALPGHILFASPSMKVGRDGEL